MKKTRFTETQIVSILKQQEGGRTTKELARVNTEFLKPLFTIGRVNMVVWKPRMLRN